jgi:hypothetical protein
MVGLSRKQIPMPESPNAKTALATDAGRLAMLENGNVRERSAATSD